MTAWEFRLGDADRDKYPRGDEWFLYDDEQLYDATPDDLDKLETEMGYRIHRFLNDLDEMGVQAVRAAMWMARRRVGVQESWGSFQPKVFRMQARRPVQPRGDDAVPPASSSPPSSTGDEPETSPSTSDPDSPAPTRGSRRRTSAA